MTILLFIIIIAILIFVHELGHFLAAKAIGVRVDEFGLGFPPRLISWQRGETLYSLNAIPFGGFVRIFGETVSQETENGQESDRSLTSKPKWQQAGVLLAGVFFNWLLAWVLISVGFITGLPMSAESARSDGLFLNNIETVIIQVLPESPAEIAGLRPGDKILYINTAQINLTKPSVMDFQETVKSAPGVVTIGFERVGSGESQMTITPLVDPDRGQPMIGVALDEIGTLKLPVHLALVRGFEYTLQMTWGLLTGIKEIFIGLLAGQSVKEAVIGPIGIAGLVGDARALGFVYLMTFAAFISIDLAIINLIPFPALDGGRLLFLVIEAVKGSPIKARVANTLNLVGFLLLVLLMFVITASDIMRLF